jgi:hypothetical protein
MTATRQPNNLKCRPYMTLGCYVQTVNCFCCAISSYLTENTFCPSCYFCTVNCFLDFRSYVTQNTPLQRPVMYTYVTQNTPLQRPVMYTYGLHVKYCYFLNNFHQILNASKISWKSVRWEPNSSMRTDGRTDRTTLTLVFRNSFAESDC